MHSKITSLVAGLLIVVAVFYLIVSRTESTAQVFLTVEELQELGADAVGRNVTVSGAVLGESIIYDAMAPRITFTIAQVPGEPQAIERAGGLEQVLHMAAQDPFAARLEIVYSGVKPDMLRHEAQAIMRGQLGIDGRFYADEILLKCPSRYEEALPEQVSG
ncbi:MAG: Cytochrome c-type biogenesis protein CcmE [Chloroflexi bacterium ADurb.Bin360]|nr:MAG: Cytochrome c-type biogenesis protein CcmE [Chloroflexi bacterium ADurb.Bin360]